MPAVQKPSKYDQRYHNMVSAILRAPTPERWRLASAAFLHLNRSDWDPVAQEYVSAREATRRVLAENQEERQMNALAGRKFATSEDDSMRDCLRMPAGMLAHIELFDPEVLKTKGGLHKLMRAFPEFTVSDKV